MISHIAFQGTQTLMATKRPLFGRGSVQSVNTDTFQQEVIEASHQQPVLVDFYADWCGPCKRLAPQLDALASNPQYQGIKFVKVNTDENTPLVEQYGIQSIPNLKLFKNGQTKNVSSHIPALRKVLDQAL